MVTLINRFTVHGDGSEFEKVFEASSEFMRKQPGFLRHRLVRSLSDPQVYVNLAEWESVERHQEVVGSPEFAEHIKGLASLAKVEPDLYSPIFEREHGRD
jgi:long-chain acyl-CoA synthetase